MLRKLRLRRRCYTASEALAHYNAAAQLALPADQYCRLVAGRNNVWRLRPDPRREWVTERRRIDIDREHFVLVDEAAYIAHKDTCWFVRAREILTVESITVLPAYPWLEFHYMRLTTPRARSELHLAGSRDGRAAHASGLRFEERPPEW